jgi:hypothetical protein
VDDPGPPVGAEQVEQPPGESEMSDEVGRELALDALRAEPPRHVADAGVVHEQVDRSAVGPHPLGEHPHRVEVGQIQLPGFRPG